MKCPKCGLINAPTAERCDCGFGFRDGSFVAPVQVSPPGELFRRAGCALGILGLLLPMVLRAIAARNESLRLIAGVLSDLFIVAAFVGLALWIIGTLRRRRARV
jgi:hypothetical protein